MMLSVGDGIALFGVFGVIITSIIGYIKIRGNGGTTKYVSKELYESEMKTVNNGLEELKGDVKQIMKHFKITG